MKEILGKYLPENAVNPSFTLIENYGIYLKIVNERKTRHGDYREINGVAQITVNASLNKYQFLITLIHEIAHVLAYREFGRYIKPHGVEWKHTFQHLMLPFINPAIFPKALLPILAQHFKNPKASSDTDVRLAVALKEYSDSNNKNYIFELPFGSLFKVSNGRIFRKGKKRIKRYECIEVSTGKIYIFQPHAEVELVK
ncbi:MAG: SprT-like domain-containing protein [Mesonia hippocampi]|uniref:SprT-like domain-containing protein n=1 Tax=Mesonia hippocampi TaxID=1628250 RepID=UPI003F9C36A2